MLFQWFPCGPFHILPTESYLSTSSFGLNSSCSFSFAVVFLHVFHVFDELCSAFYNVFIGGYSLLIGDSSCFLNDSIEFVSPGVSIFQITRSYASGFVNCFAVYGNLLLCNFRPIEIIVLLCPMQIRFLIVWISRSQAPLAWWLYAELEIFLIPFFSRSSINSLDTNDFPKSLRRGSW